MRTACALTLIALSGLPLAWAEAAGAAERVSQFRLEPDNRNVGECGGLDAVLARIHTVTARDGDIELTSAGGIEGRMSQVKPGLYRIAFELEGRRVDAVADLAATPATLTVTERNRPCRWLAAAQ